MLQISPSLFNRDKAGLECNDVHTACDEVNLEHLFEMIYNGTITTGAGNVFNISTQFSTQNQNDSLSVKINGQDAAELTQEDLQWLNDSFTL